MNFHIAEGNEICYHSRETGIWLVTPDDENLGEWDVTIMAMNTIVAAMQVRDKYRECYEDHPMATWKRWRVHPLVDREPINVTGDNLFRSFHDLHVIVELV